MTDESQKFFPGDEATPEQLIALAEEFRKLAESLFNGSGRRKGLAWSPVRFLAIHAMELYLTAYLRMRGFEAGTLRGLGHDLSARRTLARKAGLVLTIRTEQHLDALSKSRDYLVSRYGPEMNGDPSPPNRFEASLREVATKVRRILTS